MLLAPAGSPLTARDRLVVSTGASAAVTFVATPTELLKCRLQARSPQARQSSLGASLHLCPAPPSPCPSKIGALSPALGATDHCLAWVWTPEVWLPRQRA